MPFARERENPLNFAASSAESRMEFPALFKIIKRRETL
jgi:hypothetical protein